MLLQGLLLRAAGGTALRWRLLLRTLLARLLAAPCACAHVTAVLRPLATNPHQVDPSIIGGVILSLGDKYVDMSILARVRKLQQIVRDAV